MSDLSLLRNFNNLELVACAKIFRKQNFLFLAHYHPQLEIMYVISGALVIEVFSSDGEKTTSKKHVLNPNDYIFLSSGTPHSFICTADCMFYTLEFSKSNKRNVYNLTIEQLFSESHSEFFNQLKNTGYFVSNDDEKTVESCIKHLRNNSTNKTFSGLKEDFLELKYLRETYIQELFCLMSLNASREKQKGHHVIRAIDRFINANFKKEINLDDIASHVKISKFHMQKLYKSLKNQTIYETITLKRLEYAKQLLLNTKLSVSEVAIQSGFKIRQQLIYNFKQYYNVTPSEFIKKANNNTFEFYNNPSNPSKRYKKQD